MFSPTAPAGAVPVPEGPEGATAAPPPLSVSAQAWLRNLSQPDSWPQVHHEAPLLSKLLLALYHLPGFPADRGLHMLDHRWSLPHIFLRDDSLPLMTLVTGLPLENGSPHEIVAGLTYVGAEEPQRFVACGTGGEGFFRAAIELLRSQGCLYRVLPGVSSDERGCELVLRHRLLQWLAANRPQDVEALAECIPLFRVAPARGETPPQPGARRP